MKIPRLTGKALVAARMIAEGRVSGPLLRTLVRGQMGMEALLSLPEAYRGSVPLETCPLSAGPLRPRPQNGLPLPTSKGFPQTAARITQAYREGKQNPVAVAERALSGLSAVSNRRPSMNVLTENDPQRTLAEARASEERYARGAALGPLDGVPVLIKDEFHVVGLTTRLGTRCASDARATADATVVTRLARSGAVFLGKTVLTEWGMSPTGANKHYNMPKNVHHTSHAPGGSSTGSAVGVALGLAPVAAGSDGGGSIRIPSALNGIFGIKPTFGRVSRAGDGFAGSSVSHAGPIGASTLDLVAFLDAVATEQDPQDPCTRWAKPPPEGGFGAYLGSGVEGLRIGVLQSEIADADPEITRAVEQALAALEKEGAVLVPIDVPLAKHAPSIGYLAIAPESVASVRHAWTTQRDEIADDTRLTFAVMAGISTLDQIDAERLRTGLRRQMAEVFAKVDVLVLPTTATTAPRLPDGERASFADPEAVARLCRHAFLGNLTGLPAGTAPIGLDRRGLPIGLQVMGDAWDEAIVLSVLAHLERMGMASVVKPHGVVDLIGV